MRRLLIVLVLAVSGVLPASGASADHDGLTGAQRHALLAIARDTWRFFDVATDPVTHLPLDNIGLQGAPARGTYTSPTNVGVYFWSVVAAQDLGLIDRPGALRRADATLTEVERLTRWHGFLLSWYDTSTGHRISGPGGTDREGQPLTGEFISNVDNAWYATGLILVRQAFPELGDRATALLDAMDFGTFYDARDQSTDVTAGQMYGGFNADVGPATFHYGVLDTETRIGAYVGLGTGRMPGDVWWRTWRTLPADFDWQAQVPQGPTVTVTDPRSGKQFSVVEGHYSSNGIDFVPSWGGSTFEGLMPSLVVPEAEWGQRTFGLNDLRYAQAQAAYARRTLGYPVWGLSPASTPDDTGNYLAYGAHGLSSNANCCPYDETAVTPHASFLALQFTPQAAFANIEAMRQGFAVYGPYGFFDSLDPRTGSIGHRYLVLDQSMIMAALDAVLDGGLHSRFQRDPVIRAARPYLGAERFSIT
jgi:Putative glucoamylase